MAEEDFEESSWTLRSATQVEEVKMVIRLLPIRATTIIFWTSYAQMMTFSVQQESTMDRSIGNFQIQLAGSLTVFYVQKLMLRNQAVNLDCTYVTIFRKTHFFCLQCNNTGFTKLQKMAIGLVLATIGMGAAALCERKKLAVAKANRGLSPLPIRVFLLPQFLLAGSGNAFTYTGQLDFLASPLVRASLLAPYPLVSSSAVSWFGLLRR